MRILWLLALLTISLPLSAQIENPVSWKTSYEAAGDDEFVLVFTARIEDGWTIYSQYLESDDGPVATAFSYDEGSHFRLEGKNEEQSDYRKEGFDDIFGMNVIKYAHEVSFRQRIKLLEPGKPITGYLTFMTCDDSRCLPPTEVDFSFSPATTTQTPSLSATLSEEPLAPVAAPGAGGGLEKPLHWSATITKVAGNEYDLSLTAQIEDGWYTYSMFLEEDGPVPTAIYFDDESLVERIGAPVESGSQMLVEYDNTFGMELKKFKHDATFTQRIRVSDPSQAVTGYIESMVCDESRCLPPTPVDFQALPAEGTASTADDETGSAELANTGTEVAALAFNMTPPDLDNPVGQCAEVEALVTQGGSSWQIFLLGFIGGLLALLTPCVFPMIPLTVSFFTKSNSDRRKGIANAFLYGFFIFLVYFILSIPFHLLDTINPDILNDISTNVWLNVIFFIIFLVFAFSFFGYYELTLPSSWANKVSAAEGIGGVVGIFFMALTLALVSFSCTGPILGSLLASSLTAEGGAMQLTVGMSGFGLALALPFALFAAFPSWMNSLPRSGGWLNTVKVVLGFLELALALKFLSNADLVKHWGVLRIEPFLAAWILVFLGMALYLFGIIRFPHDTPPKKLPAARVALGALSTVFVLYLASGFLTDEQSGSYRPLKLLSGLAPPVCYSFFQPCDCPQQLTCFKDLNQGLAFAKENNKPILLDFTGYACVNCRKMEEHVWPEDQVYSQLKDDYVLISLYVDDKKELPAAEQLPVAGRSRPLRTYGNKWSHFQTTYFQTNTQPYYALISPEGELLNPPVGYTPDADEFAQFLECGQHAFRELSEKKGNDQDAKRLGSIR